MKKLKHFILYFGFAGVKFTRDEGFIRASALTFYSLFAIIPTFAVVFGIAKGFGFEEFLENQLQTEFQAQETALKYVIEFAHSMLEQSRGGLIAGIGLLLLFASIFKMLNHIEIALNRIWNVKNSLNINKKVMQYLAIMFLSPMILICSSSFSIFISEYIKDYHLVVYVFSSSFSLVMVILLLTWLFQLLPNTKVFVLPAFIAGLTTGLGYIGLQWLMIQFQVVISGLGAVYGSFAALPILLIWLQTSWVIIFFGAALSYTVQHKIRKYKDIPPYNVSWQENQQLSKEILTLFKKHFTTENPSLTIYQVARKLDISSAVIQHWMQKLVEGKFLAEIRTSNVPEYILVRNPEQLEGASLDELLANA